jgi:tetratricopeptide (TPR) repeat protein
MEIKMKGFIIILFINSSILIGQEIMTPDKWNEDINYLYTEIINRHVEPFNLIAETDLFEAFEELKQLSNHAERHEMIVGLAELITMIGDGHTRLWLSPNKSNNFTFIPIEVRKFSDGVYIQSTDLKNKKIVGGKITHVNNVPIDSVVNRLSKVIPKDNQYTVLATFPVYIMVPEILHALRIIQNKDAVPLTIEKNGQVSDHTLFPTQYSRSLWKDHFWKWESAYDERLMVSSRNPESTPLYLQRPKDKSDEPLYIWHSLNEAKKYLYVKYDVIANPKNQSIADYFKNLKNLSQDSQVDKLIIDLRENGGGNNMLNNEVVKMLINWDEMNQFGKLFIIIGRYTFSAASHLISKLETYTEAIFVGEPTGASPNHFGDARRFTLPNSKLTVGVSSLYWQNTTPFDKRKTTYPYLSVDISFEEYMNNEDPVLEAIFSFNEKAPLNQLLEENAAGEYEKLTKIVSVFQENPLYEYFSTAKIINSLGYKFLNKNMVPEAIKIFRLNLQFNPSYSNGYDSLADAYLRNNDTENTKKIFQKLLEIAPESPYAERARTFLKDN